MAPILLNTDNVTIVAPYGTSQHGHDNLLCVPTLWTTIVRFFVTNYVAHAFTLWSKPGEKTLEKVFASILALLFPVSGLARGVDAIWRHAAFHTGTSLIRNLLGFVSNKYEIDKAAKAGALCILARHHAEDGDEPGDEHFEFGEPGWASDGARIRARLTCPPSVDNAPPIIYRIKVERASDELNVDDLRWNRNISGISAQGPHENTATAKRIGSDSYRVMELPATLANDIEFDDEGYSVNVAQTSNLLAIVIAVVQIVYSSYQLAVISADQFDRYGYSAFSITTIPYIVMSFINLIGNLLTPTYPSLYIVKTFVLEEAESRGIKFGQSIGRIDESKLRGWENRNLDKIPISPWKCLEDRKDEFPSHQESPLPVCFNHNCKQAHADLNTPSGKPEFPETSLRKAFAKLTILLLAILFPFALIVYFSQTFPKPPRADEAVILPLWLATGSFIGVLILFKRIDASQLLELQFLVYAILPGIKASGPEKRYVKKHWRTLLMKLFLVLGGLVIAVYNFYLVGLQIWEFGDCSVIS
ncbi:hypothetical protein F4680DRAFT_403065 [Xylaria scruposa]|nr:hypothetical protein F4680DRAFT_403065 [Xylaria scruposa]